MLKWAPTPSAPWTKAFLGAQPPQVLYDAEEFESVPPEEYHPEGEQLVEQPATESEQQPATESERSHLQQAEEEDAQTDEEATPVNNHELLWLVIRSIRRIGQLIYFRTAG